MPKFEPVLTRNWNVEDSHTLRVYESRGGYKAARKALTEMEPDQVVGVVKDSELRGRGGAGFPCGMKWSFLPKDRKETFLCVNGDESEPATFNNRILMEKDPHQFLEGILIACYAPGPRRRTSISGSSTSRRIGSSNGRSPRPARRATSARISTARASIWKSGSIAGRGPTSAARKPA